MQGSGSNFPEISSFPKILLNLLCWIYGILVRMRLVFYRKKLLRSLHPGIPVISVGNLTVGGTGKTPMVGFLTESAKQSGWKPAIISRGYRNRSHEKIQRVRFCENPNLDVDAFGDEPSMLALENPEVPVYVSASRVDAAEVAKERDNPEILILDDAFQHLKIKRDLNLLLIDAERGFGNSQLLPLGPLREPLESAERADAVIVTKSNLGNFDEVTQTLLKFKRDDCPVFQFDYRIEKITSLDGQEEKETSELKGKRLLLSSGIANPQSFSKMLKLEEGCPVAEMRFEDHHNYSESSIRKMIEQGNNTPHDFWLTTEKDAVKLKSFQQQLKHLWVVKMKLQPDPEWPAFFNRFLDGLSKTPISK